MRIAIRIALLIIIGVLAYFTYESIAGPVRHMAEVEVKETAVIEKLKLLQKAELAYRDERGVFTKSFDTLENFVLNGKMIVTIEEGDRDDSTTVYTVKKVYKSIKEELFSNVDEEEIKNMKYVPFHDNTMFLIDTATVVQNNISVPVFQITDPKPFSEERIKEKNPLRVGDIYSVDYSGNWKGNR
jgi:hypothetical protein